MRLPGPEGLMERRGLVKGIVDTLLSPACLLFPKSPACTKEEPAPNPQPTQNPIPNPVIQPTQTVPVPAPAPTTTQGNDNTNLPQKPPVESPNPVPEPVPQPAPTLPSTPDPPIPTSVEKPPPASGGGGSGSGDGGNSGGGSNTGIGSGTSGSGSSGNSGSSNSGNGNNGNAITPDRTESSSEISPSPGGGNSNTVGSGGSAVIIIPAGDGSDDDSVRGSGPSGVLQKGVNPTATLRLSPVTTGAASSGVNGDHSSGGAETSGNGRTGATGNGLGSGVSGDGHGGSGGTRTGDGNPNDDGSSNGSRPNPVPGIVGAIVAILLILLILLALLYRYRRNRHVQAFLQKFTPFKIAPYTKREKKRSSMGNGLLFSDIGDSRDSAMYEKRTTLNYGTLPSPVTHPSPTAARSPRIDEAPPVLDMSLLDRRISSPTSELLIDFSPLMPDFPRSPSPTAAPRRASQDSVGGTSIASSGVFSPSLISWPMPPSSAPSTRPNTSYGQVRYSLMPSLSDLPSAKPPPTGNPRSSLSSPGPADSSHGQGVGQSRFSTMSRPTQQDVMPSNWVKPRDWN